jgi:hypothetical protein
MGISMHFASYKGFVFQVLVLIVYQSLQMDTFPWFSLEGNWSDISYSLRVEVCVRWNLEVK